MNGFILRASIALAVFGIICNLAYFTFLVTRSERQSKGIELPKSDCIEICVKVSQRESVWPKEYHQLVQRCNDLFAGVETCRLR